MILFDDILAGYDLSDGAILNAGRSGGLAAPDRMRQAERVNDSAYLFMLFARFEHLVTERARVCAASGRQATTPSVRRVWLAIDVDKMDFTRRLALLTDKGGSDYRDVQELYQDRNRIGHGQLLETKPNVPAIAAKLSGILSRVEGTP